MYMIYNAGKTNFSTNILINTRVSCSNVTIMIVFAFMIVHVLKQNWIYFAIVLECCTIPSQFDKNIQMEREIDSNVYLFYMFHINCKTLSFY